MKRLFLLSIAVLLFIGRTQAAEYPYIYKGIRPMGMGGAFVAVSDDINALFYNPAGLANVSGIRASIIPLEMEVGKNSLDMYRDATDVDFDNVQETTDFLRDYVGERAHLGVTLFPNFVMPRFGVCLIGTGRADLEVYDLQYPKVDTHVINDLGVGAGYAHPLMDDNLLVGASLKYLHRQSLNQDYTVIDITTDDLDNMIEDDLQKGNGVLMDLGLIYKLADVGIGKAQVGISANNLIGSRMGDAENIDDHIDIGFATTFDVWVSKATVAVDYVDLFSQLDMDNDFGKRVRLGAEVKLPILLTLRAGFYQGYFTGGMNFDARFVQMDFVSYAEEIGAYAGQRMDRRYLLRFLIGF